MAKSDLGKKHLCPNCEKCFYDLKRDPAVCPKCGTEIEPPKRSRTKRVDNSKRPAASKLPDVVDGNAKTAEFDDGPDILDDKALDIDDDLVINDEDDEPQQVEGGDEQENVIGDTSDIGGVDDGISEVLEHVDKAVAD